MKNITDEKVRADIIDNLSSDYNLKRKNTSVRQYRCYKDNLDQYVQERLLQSFSVDTFKMMPVTSSINLVKRITEQVASVYKTKPIRNFTNIDEETKNVIDLIYKDSFFDAKMIRLNILFALQNHTHLYIRLKNGKIELKPLCLHQIDVIENEQYSEDADGYVISNYNNRNIKQAPTDYTQVSSTGYRGTSDAGYIQQKLKTDEEKSKQRFTFWTDEFNFVCDGNGKIIGENDLKNEISIIPIVEIVNEKDLDYFLDQGSSVTEFSIDYNVSISDLMFISRLQGFAQGAISGDKEVLDKMNNVLLGPAYIIKLPNSPINGTETKLQFISRSSDLAGSRENIEFLLSSFLTSRGIDPKTITGKGEATRFNSGFERLLAMVEKFEASILDYQLFQKAEINIFNVIKKYINTYSNTEFLDKKYWVNIPENCELEVTFSPPSLVQSASEKIDSILKRLDAGLISKVDAIMELNSVSRDKAIEILETINEDKLLEIGLIKDALDESKNQSNMEQMNSMDSEDSMEGDYSMSEDNGNQDN